MLQKAVIEPGSRLNRETHKILDDLRVKLRISDIEEIHTAKVNDRIPDRHSVNIYEERFVV